VPGGCCPAALGRDLDTGSREHALVESVDPLPIPNVVG
jgi:hypothetical protein